MQALNNISNRVSYTVAADGVNGLGFVPPMSSKAGNAFDIDYVKVKDILTDEKNFQNRQDKYSEKSVEAIIKAVKNGAFNWFAFDPVLLWQSPDGKKYVLSGHSRTEAFRRLSKEKPQIIIDGLAFDRIPAKIYKGDFISAKNLALNSNALATPETLLERADFYRKQRKNIDNNEGLKKLREKALRENQGSVIWDLSYIPKGGLTDDFLRRFKMQEDSPNAFENYIRAVNIAQWIGKAFQIYKGLGTLHDTELFNFLNDNYGTKSGQYNSFAKLNERLQVLYPRNVKNDKKVQNGIYTTPFGLQVFAKTDAEVNEIEDLKKLADTAKKDLKRKIDDLRGRTTDKEKVFEIVTPFFNAYVNALLDWWRTLDTERKRQEDKNQTSLFGLEGVKKSNYDNAIADLFADVQQLKMQLNELKQNPTSIDYGNLFEQKYTIDHRFDSFITSDVFKLINEAYDRKILSRRWNDRNGDTWQKLSNELANEMTFYLSCFPFHSAAYKNAKSYITALFDKYPEKSLTAILRELRNINDIESFRRNRPIDFDRRWSVEYYENNFDDQPVTKIIDFSDVSKYKVNTLGECNLGSIRVEKPPKKTGIGYKVFVLKKGKLYPPMVANPGGVDTPIGVWLNADAAPIAGMSKTGRPQVKAGGKGTQGGSGVLAYRPGWHLGIIPYAIQFNRQDENGERTLFPKNFVWAEVEYAADVNYQKEAEKEGMTKNGKYNHAYAGLKKVPKDGFYIYRTNPDPKTDPWIITGAMKVNRVLSNAEVDDLVRRAGRKPQRREGDTLGAIDLTKRQPSEIFNCPESMLQCKGFSPTYERLADYSSLIDTADGVNKFVGTGFDKTTLNTLVDTCQKYYPQVSRLAAHLADPNGDELQTCFNIWHWEHNNLRYNYDAAGREEIRTPARTWQDRYSGVDCDCLAVFTACLLLNLGYKPKFEIVGFGSTPKYSHIFVNLGGACIDRVLPNFLQRAPLITKTMYMEIPVYQLSGLGAMPLQLQEDLNGLYRNTLSKVFTHTATPEELLDFRKTQVLVTLGNVDPDSFKIAGIVMPYVEGIDDKGAFYFDNGEIAQAAANAENELTDLEMRGLDTELGKLKIFKKLKNAVKKAVKSVGNAVKTVAKGTANVVKSAVKSTANAVKASANLVKAGAQAVAGKGSAAKATLRKAAQQVKKSVVEPVKTVAKTTKDVVKVTVINPTKTVIKAASNVVKQAIKIGAKLFKVIFIKLNPATILIRQSLRLLVALNFLGMATRMNVANLSKEEAIKQGYTEQQWNDAKKAKDKVVRFFTKMGGKAANIERAIVNGAKKKALFKGSYNNNSKIVETGTDDAQLSGTAEILSGLDGLGAAVTIGSALAAVGAFIAKIWGWIKNIVPKIGKGVVTAAKAVGKGVTAVVKKVAPAVKEGAKKALDTLTQQPAAVEPVAPVAPVTPLIAEETENKSNWVPWAVGGALAVGAIILLSNNKKKRA